jgi:hypothetical protein
MWYCYITAVATPATFMMAATQYDFQTQTGNNHGLWNRISLAIGLGWLGLVALRLILDAAEAQRAPDTTTAPSGRLAVRP